MLEMKCWGTWVLGGLHHARRPGLVFARVSALKRHIEESWHEPVGGSLFAG